MDEYMAVNPIDGGLGLGTITPGDTTFPSFVASLKAEGVISDSVFAIYLSYVNVSTPEFAGKPSSNLEIGGYDLSKYSADGKFVTTLAVHDPSESWNVLFDTIKLGNQVVGSAAITHIDTGYIINYAPESNYSLLVSYFTGNTSGYSCKIADDDVTLVCNCSAVSEMPDLTLSQGEYDLVADRKSLWNNYVSGKCALQLHPQSQDAHWTLGLVFAVNYYTVFDLDNLKISFAHPVRSELSWALGLAASLLGLILS
jgi:hypothetical protein